MTKRRSKAAKRNTGYRVRFDRGSALATGLGTALLLAPGQPRTESQSSVGNLGLEAEPASSRGTTPLAASTIMDRVYGQSTSSAPATIRVPDVEWTEADEKRFDELAITEAVAELTPEEAFELEILTISHRAHLRPRSGDEVLWEFEQRRITRKLLETLSRYVEFYEGADPAWARSGESSY